MADFEGFLSYTHLDDELGEITEFKNALETMVTRLRGTPFVFFQDQDGLRTGDLWEKKIEHALEQSSVLVTILSPTFFNCKWCRYEVERFLELKAEQGKPAVVIPIYWLKIPVMERPELLKDHPIAQKVAALQYYNWTEHFGESLTSPPLRKALKTVAEDLLNQLETAPAPIPTVTSRTKAPVARLEVTNAPAGAALVVNGVAVAGLVYEITLPEGTHEHAAEVVVSAPGFRTEEWDVVLVVDHPVALDATLDPLPVPRIVKRTGTKPTVYTAPLTLAEYKAQLQTIPGGSFKREGFTVTLSPFQMGRTPVTVGMWQEYAKDRLKGKMPELPEFPVWKDGWDAVPDHPIVGVSWEDCNAYADWAGLILPTEAQWEYAARGGLVGKIYPWGDEWNVSKAWCSKEKPGDSGGTAPVVRSERVFVNSYGLVDMSGNIWEWCADWYGDYEQGNATNPTGASSGTARIVRGCSWNINNEAFFRCAGRYWHNPGLWYNSWGFRLVLGG